jgi:putative ABC transport system permease protein
MRFLFLIFDNILRNPVRSLLTSLGTMVLVLVVTLVFTVLTTLDQAMAAKSRNFKAIVTEKWQLPSQMPYSYAAGLTRGAAEHPGDMEPADWMTWGFYFGSIEQDAAKQTFKNSLPSFIMEPEKLLTMMDDLGPDDCLPGDYAAFKASVEKLIQQRQGAILGRTVLENLGKRVGDRITIYGRNIFAGIDFELDIVGQFPPGRYDQSAVIRRDYFNDTMDAYQRNTGKPHRMADRSLNLVWLKMNDHPQFEKIAEQVSRSPAYTSPAVKIETASSGIASFLEAYRDILWGVRWVLAPACAIVLSLGTAIAISISVRERRIEFAVLKVLGYRPDQILVLVLGEALVIGVVSGFLSAAATYVGINFIWGGLPFRIAFFPKFLVPWQAWWWGAALGAVTALAGSIVPAWSARSVKVADVFSKVA